MPNPSPRRTLGVLRDGECVCHAAGFGQRSVGTGHHVASPMIVVGVPFVNDHHHDRRHTVAGAHRSELFEDHLHAGVRRTVVIEYEVVAHGGGNRVIVLERDEDERTFGDEAEHAG